MFEQGKNFIGFFHEDEEYGFLSNWYKCCFKSGRQFYTSVEQYMMHMKVLMFCEYDLAEKIMKTDEPSECKKIGRTKFDSFDSKKWDSLCVNIVKRGVRAKFMQNPELLERLLATGDCILAECSPYDIKWGIGIDISNQEKYDVKKWNGRNLLGRILMELREEFRRYKELRYIDAMDLKPIDEWFMKPGELKRHPAYYDAIHTYSSGLRNQHERNCFYYSASFNMWEEAMRFNMGGGLTSYGFWEMKQEIYDISRRLRKVW